MIDAQATTAPIPTVARTEPSHIHIPRPSRGPRPDERVRVRQTGSGATAVDCATES
jgi:hypothetical protein